LGAKRKLRLERMLLQVYRRLIAANILAITFPPGPLEVSRTGKRVDWAESAGE